MVQDNTDNNVQDLKNQLAAERLKEQQQAANASNTDPALAMATPAQRAAAAAYSPTGQAMPCVPGQPCPQVSYGQQMPAQPQLTPAQQQAQQLAAKERELAYNSRFASNLAYVHQADPPAQSRDTEGALASGVPIHLQVKIRVFRLRPRRAAWLHRGGRRDGNHKQPIRRRPNTIPK